MSIELLNDLWNIDDSRSHNIWQSNTGSQYPLNSNGTGATIGQGVAAARSAAGPFAPTMAPLAPSLAPTQPTHSIPSQSMAPHRSPPLQHYQTLSKINSNTSNSSSTSSTSVSSLSGPDFDYYNDSNYTTQFKSGSVSSTSTTTSSEAASPNALSPTSSSSSVPNLQQLDKKPVNTQLYKTELCDSYMKITYCPYGNKCQFAHGENELKRVDRPSNWRSKPCANWSKYGSCRYGNRCCFKHQ